MLRPVDYFGEVALAMDVPRTASVTALVPTTLASLRPGDVRRVRPASFCGRHGTNRGSSQGRLAPMQNTGSPVVCCAKSSSLPRPLRACSGRTAALARRFRPSPGEAEKLARKGLDGAVRSLTRAKRQRLVGPAPVDDEKRRIAPTDAWGHDHLWWLDRMVRTEAARRADDAGLARLVRDLERGRRLPAADAQAEPPLP